MEKLSEEQKKTLYTYSVLGVINIISFVLYFNFHDNTNIVEYIYSTQILLILICFIGAVTKLHENGYHEYLKNNYKKYETFNSFDEEQEET